jgi:endonuclease G
VRYWAGKYDGVFVVTGGVLKGDMNTIGDENVSVPNQFYKVLLDNNSEKVKMIAFLIPHENSRKPLYDFVVSVDDIEELTGIDFFPQLENSIENKLESSSRFKDWSFN